MDCLMKTLLNIIVENLDIRHEVELLARGSYGQGILSKMSDIDFEVSGPEFPSGHQAVEEMIGQFLNAFNIEWEGSSGRPDTVDIEGAHGFTRDLHEWSELRQPGSWKHNPGWVSNFFANSRALNWYKLESQYIRRNRNIVTTKFLFFQMRTIIARLAFQHGACLSSTYHQLDYLKDTLGMSEYKTLSNALNDALHFYEHQLNDEKLVYNLHKTIVLIKKRYCIP